MIFENELGIILHNQIIWITKLQLLTTGVLAFVAHFLTIGFQDWIEGKERLRQLSLFEHLRLNFATIEVICLSLFLYLLFGL